LNYPFSNILLGSFVIFSCLFSQGNAKSKKQFSNYEQKKYQTNSEEQNMQEIVLYIKSSCPYCKKVLHALNQMEKSVKVIDISNNDELTNELISRGGKKQVPCIFIDGESKYESSDIIKWLLENKHRL